MRSLLTFVCSFFRFEISAWHFKIWKPYIGLPLSSLDSSDQRWSSDGKLRKLLVILKGLENFLCAGEHLIAGNSKLAAWIFPPWSFTRQDDWLTRTTWDIAHAIPCDLRECKKSTSEKSWKIVFLPALFASKLSQGPLFREKVFGRNRCEPKLHASCASF